MMKPTVFALLGLAIALTLASPSQAHAGVAVGIGVGPVYGSPAYGYVAVHPRPYAYYHPYAYAPGYVHPAYRYARPYGDRGWGYRDYDRRAYAGRGYGYRHDYRR
jgi:hypothetical protein